jgi:hypothetical protein
MTDELFFILAQPSFQIVLYSNLFMALQKQSSNL